MVTNCCGFLMVLASKCVRKGQRSCASTMWRLLRATIAASSPPLKPNMIFVLSGGSRNGGAPLCGASFDSFEHLRSHTPIHGAAFEDQPLVGRHHRDRF